MGSPVNNSRTVMVGDNLSSAKATTAIEELIQDSSPQLGADLDCNGYDIQFDDGTGIEDDSGNKTLLFGKTTSATTYAKITNNATGTTGPLLEAAGETNIDLRLAAAGTGDVKVTTGGLRVTSDNEALSVGAGNDLALTHDGSNSTITGGVGKITVTPAAGSVLELDNSNCTVDNGSVQVTGDLDVDNISIDGNTVSSTSGDLQLKAVSGSSITFQDDADATKQLTLNFATIGSGTERTWTFPNTDGTFTASGLSSVVADTSPQLGGFLDANGNYIQMQKGGDISSASPTVIDTDGDYFIVTGTTNFSALTVAADRHFFLEFAAILTITHGSGTIDLPGGANITTAAGDVAEFVATAANVVTCVNYTKINGGAVKIVDESIDSDAYVDASIDTAHIATNQIDETLMKDAFVADFTEVTVATGDSLIFGDATDSGNTKRDTIQGVLDLAVTAAVGTNSIWIPSLAMKPTASNPCSDPTTVETTSGRPDMQVLDFDDGSDEHAQFNVAFPKSWNEGTITFQVYWCCTASDTDGVSWGLQGVSVPDNSTIDVAYGTAVVVDDANQGAAEEMLVTAVSSAVTIAGAAVDTVTFFRIFRDVSDANDTAAEDARLLGVKLFFTTNAQNDD